MKNKEFKKLLFKGAFSAMACDGEIAESEVLEMKEMLFNSPYFKGLDYSIELENAHSDIRTNGVEFIEDFFNNLTEFDLTEQQEVQLIEVLIKIVEADGKIMTSELHFMHNTKSALKQLSDVKLIAHFPRNFDLLVNLEKFEGHKLQHNLESIDFSALEYIKIASE